ncbi:MAG: hypothetical protein GY702_07135 [Desulfobulbaceae bacterium]|nr:hypothetical protein [Desulfobulbaceae bacterium]
MNEPGALDERLRTLVMHSFEGGGERLHFLNSLKPFLLYANDYLYWEAVWERSERIWKILFCRSINGLINM